MTKPRQVLIFGDAGAMGGHLTRLLAGDGWDVTLMSRSDRPPDNVRTSLV